MPLYTFGCVDCGYRGEQIRSHTHRNRRQQCPNCGTGILKRGIGAPAGLITKSAQTEPAMESIQTPERLRTSNTTSVTIENSVMANSATAIVAGGADVAINGLNLDGVTRAFVTDERAELKLKNVVHDAGPGPRAKKRKK
jgi:putative FmdB family regulatory protein